MMDIIDLMEKIKTEARRAGAVMLEASDILHATSEKGSNKNLVTEYDRKIQDFLEDALKKILPEAKFLGEENHEDLFRKEYSEGFLFIIDPIDGTSNFIFGYRPSVTSIALFKDGKPYIGVIYNPYSDEIFYAAKGHGAFRNDLPIHTSTLPLSKSLVSMGTAPYYSEEMIKNAFDTGFSYMPCCVDIRRSGTAAWDLCQVACGSLGLFFEPLLQLWDYAAGALIVTEAGGVVTDMDGKNLSERGASSVIAAGEGVAAGEYLPGRLFG